MACGFMVNWVKLHEIVFIIVMILLFLSYYMAIGPNGQGLSKDFKNIQCNEINCKGGSFGS